MLPSKVRKQGMSFQLLVIRKLSKRYEYCSVYFRNSEKARMKKLMMMKMIIIIIVMKKRKKRRILAGDRN